MIRALDAADWRRWKDVRLRALAEAPEAFCSTLAGTEERERAEGEEPYWRGYFRLPGTALIAERDGRTVGMVRLVLPEQSGEPAELFSMWVAPEERGRGTGRALLDACAERLARSHPSTPLRLDVRTANTAAQALYRSSGYVDIGGNPEDESERRMLRPAARPS